MSAVTPRLAATIERRLLVNHRLDPAVAAALLPGGLRPQLVDGSAVAGICLIRMAAVRPAGLPAVVGWRGEAAAHRIAVEWDGEDGPCSGVFIPVRQSASRLPVLAGGRLLPGVHRRARFRVLEGGGRYRISVLGADESVDVTARDSGEGWSSTLFPTPGAASDFFRDGAVGWSPNRAGTALEGLALTTDAWRVRPAVVDAVSSSFFDRLPAGSASFDSALLMTRVPVVWRRPAVRPPARALQTASAG